MKNFKPLLKRVGAYTIDLFLVLIISSLITGIPLISKHLEDYRTTYSEYTEEYTKYDEYITLLNEAFEDDEINEEEYTKLIESEQYKDLITSKYEDNKISKKEYKDLVSEINKEFDKEVKEYSYILGKQGVLSSIVTLICTLLYFGVIQYFFKGQTLGKKILKIKVVSATNKKINILNYLLRSLIVNDVLLNTIGIIFLVLSSKGIYTNANIIIGILISISEALIIYLVLTREDQRGLHDLLFNTKVVSTDETTNIIKSNNKEKELKELSNEKPKRRNKK